MWLSTIVRVLVYEGIRGVVDVVVCVCVTVVLRLLSPRRY